MDIIVGAIYHTSKGTMRVLRAHAHAVQVQIATYQAPNGDFVFDRLVHEFARQEFIDINTKRSKVIEILKAGELK